MKKIKLTNEQRIMANKLIDDLGREYNLQDRKLDLLADFVVRLKLSEENSKMILELATDRAKKISKMSETKVLAANFKKQKV